VSRVVAAALLFVLAGNLWAQRKANPLALDPSRPVVDIRFERFDNSGARGGEGPILFLRLRNNLRCPIRVFSSNGAIAGSVEVKHEIERLDSFSGVPSGPPVKSKWIGPPRELHGSDVGGDERIEPGSTLLFGVPWNHVGPTWSIKLTFRLDLPVAGRQPVGVVDYTWTDVPPGIRDAWLAP
jgi:hypothetical protein